MDPLLITADDRQRAPSSWRGRDFWRLVRWTRPYRQHLILGLCCTVVFAGLHTVGIGGAFPVFQVLLEEEGLQGWADRAIAGKRLGVEFTPLTDDYIAHLVRVPRDTNARESGLRPGDQLRDPRGRPIRVWLADVVQAAPGSDIAIIAKTLEGQRAVTLRAADMTFGYAMLNRARGLLPADSPDTKLRTLVSILAVLVIVAITSNVFRYIGETLIARAILRTLFDLRDALYERILHLPMTFFASTSTADLVTRFVQDVQEVQRGLITLFGKFVREPLRAVFLIGLALTLDWRITITMSLVVPVALALFWAVGRSVKKANRKLLQAYGAMIGALTASLQSLRVVKAYTAEEHERARLDEVDQRMFRQQLRLAQLDAFLSPMMETLAVLTGSVLTVWLASRVLNHTLSVSVFAALGVTLAMMFDPLRKMSDVYVRIQRASAGAERIFQVLDRPVETVGPATGVELKPLETAMEFANVSFAYPDAAGPALSDVNLTIRRGETVALVGPNGSGKTTLVSLLPRLFDAVRGEVRYDGLNVQRATHASLRRQFGLVPQEAVIFEGTPVENIAYGNGRVDRAKVEDAARRAYADDFIRALTGGYDAVLGERGTTLSGGQRQRLAIARAIYRDAPILIFDEATSQIDSESELKIQNALREFAKGRTTIIIAHRLSTIQFADRIVVMDAGRVVDSGTHEELFNRCQVYRTLCETQFVNTGT
jgi:ABC-type multidrug transport system fused ATPase/permease subunit